MDINSFNIHSLKKFSKRQSAERENPFSFERENSFSFPIPSKISLYPFYLKNFSLKDCIFFDTETTGLSRGAGNMVFLAGVGYVENSRFVVKQYFVSNPSVEFKLIETLIGLFKERKIVVSFNGKCFDIPVIKTRCVMNGIDEPDIEQIDLFHISRFIWKDFLNSFRLSDIEKNILGFYRKGDLPGSMAPFAYRSFLLSGKTDLLEKVFVHNLHDVVSLFKLFAKIGREDDFYVSFARARKFFSLKDYNACLNELRKIAVQKNSDKLREEIYMLASFCLKKQGDIEKAANLWKKTDNFVSHVELAKYYEHKKKDFEKALMHTDLAVKLCKNPSLLFKLEKRRERLVRKTGFFK